MAAAASLRRIGSRQVPIMSFASTIQITRSCWQSSSSRKQFSNKEPSRPVKHPNLKSKVQGKQLILASSDADSLEFRYRTCVRIVMARDLRSQCEIEKSVLDFVPWLCVSGGSWKYDVLTLQLMALTVPVERWRS